MYVVVSGEQLVFTLHCGFVVSWLITCVLLDFCVCLCLCVCTRTCACPFSLSLDVRFSALCLYDMAA